MFSPLDKLLFFKLDNFSTDPSKKISLLFVYSIASQQLLGPSRFLGFFSIESWQLLRSIEPKFLAFSLLDRLDRSSTKTSIHWAAFSIYSWGVNQISLFSFSLTPNTFLSLQSLYPRDFRPRSSLNHLVSVPKPLFFMNSCILDLGFGVFENCWGFWDFCEIFGLGGVVLLLYAHALHSHCIITMFHAF